MGRKITKWGTPDKRQYNTAGQCSHCGDERDATGRYCRKCHAAYMKLWRPKHSELSEEQRRRSNARAYANVYQKRGLLKPEPCIFCGSMENLEKHHEDYTKPLQVVWVCREHHKLWHK